MTSNFANEKIGIDALIDKLPALGTAGTPSTDVISMQGVTSGIPILMSKSFLSRSDTFIATANGTIINTSSSPLSNFTIQVSQTGSVTSWTIVLEGGLDGSTFSTILTATNIIGIGVNVFSGTNYSPCLYFRSRCTAIVLGAGTNLIATILGTN